jgi:hypothetical protein
MKRKICVLVLAAVTAGGVFAQEIQFSAGAGGLFSMDLSGGYTGSYQGNYIKIPYIGENSFLGYGGFGFFDADFAVLQVGFFTGDSELTESAQKLSTGKGSLMGLDIALLGKYPISGGEGITYFPLFGAKYRRVLSAKFGSYEYPNPGDMSAISIQAGGGIDYSLSDSMYMRGQILYGFRLASKFDDDRLKQLKALGVDAEKSFSQELDFNLAVGFKF